MISGNAPAVTRAQNRFYNTIVCAINDLEIEWRALFPALRFLAGAVWAKCRARVLGSQLQVLPAGSYLSNETAT